MLLYAASPHTSVNQWQLWQGSFTCHFFLVLGCTAVTQASFLLRDLCLACLQDSSLVWPSLASLPDFLLGANSLPGCQPSLSLQVAVVWIRGCFQCRCSKSAKEILHGLYAFCIPAHLFLFKIWYVREFLPAATVSERAVGSKLWFPIVLDSLLIPQSWSNLF